jgi:hypothetical protein
MDQGSLSGDQVGRVRETWSEGQAFHQGPGTWNGEQAFLLGRGSSHVGQVGQVQETWNGEQLGTEQATFEGPGKGEEEDQ